MDSKTLRLLLVEDDLEDEQLLCEALIEIEEHRQWCNWRSSSIVHVEQLADALDCLRQESFDAVLLNLSLPDSPALLDSFLETDALSRGTPIVVLADEEDENLANRLLREGAQDVLIKSELDCAPLARSLRYAIERQRRSHAFQCSPFADDLTRALTRQGFLTIADHCVKLSRESGAELVAAGIEVAERSAIPESPDCVADEWLLMRAAEAVRDEFGSPTLLGRLKQRCFGLLTAGLAQDTVEARLRRIAAELEEAARGAGYGPNVVRWSATRLAPGVGIEDWLAAEYGSFDRSREPAKTVMLAD